MDAHFPIRPATFADAAAMAAIERRSFSDPWPLEGFREVFGMPGTVALVMTDRDEPIAYFLAREILGTAEVLNLAVVPEYRGRGLGGGPARTRPSAREKRPLWQGHSSVPLAASKYTAHERCVHCWL